MRNNKHAKDDRCNPWYRLVVWFASAVWIMGMAGCSSSDIDSGRAEPRTISLIAPIHAGEQGDAMRLGAEAAAKAFGYQLQYASFKPDEDASEQLAAALRMVEGGVSAILIDPANEHVLEELAAAASARSIPVVALNDERLIKGVLSAITVDQVEAGRQAGEALAKLIGDTGSVAIMRSDRKDPDLELREAGIRASLAQHPSIRIVESASCGNLRDACWNAAKGMLDASHIDGAIALESGASLGLADEAKRRGEAGSLKIVAFGSQVEQLSLLQDGVIHQLVVQNDFSFGYIGMEQAVALLSGKETTGHPTMLETRVVNADNMFWMNNQKLLFPFVQ
ncbi:sugar ABC transporter substrate-binding protein [Paenibacillus sp. 1011MAR3C5]|uniref:sugar ABC transporter substrate-binding protein n=1 Tax=Paenibacillus sp. 1011MAR3C5 TaxID=1675787 RepID=UPI000E6BEE4E|nr:substrate-binding domain-containing protein [Paenibacillus sp. 1011MAR3C5]RJE84355.1 sugar ABC transporter substrate-binding protein [Paenibacillus sp. 1011MAR3C5]